jgi:hypothetical protein
MKTTNIIYWTTTSILAVMIVFAAYSYITQPAVQQGVSHLDFPDYFRKGLSVAKLIGVVLLLAPVAVRVKEWAYAGFGITFISDLIAHIASADPISERLIPILFLGLLIISYISYQRRHTAEQNTLDAWQLIS